MLAFLLLTDIWKQTNTSRVFALFLTIWHASAAGSFALEQLNVEAEGKHP